MSHSGFMTSATEWLGDLTGDASTYDISRETGIPQPTVSKQLRTGKVTPDTVVRIARKYGGKPLEGLVVLGLLDSDEAKALGRESALREADDEQLVAEVLRRIKDGSGNHSALIDPVASVEAGDEGAEDLLGEGDAARAAKNRSRKGERIDVGGTEPVVRKSGTRASRGRS